MRNALTNEELNKRAEKNSEIKDSYQIKLENILEKHKPFKHKDIVLIDSSILNFHDFMKDTDHTRFENYSTKELQNINCLAKTYYELFQEEKTTVTKKVNEELNDLLTLMNNRIGRATLPSEKRRKENWFRHRINNVEKAKTNKKIYQETRNIIYEITTLAKQNQINPTQMDGVLFRIIKTISDERQLKTNQLFDNGKKHDYESSTDEWLVAQAYNRILFDQKKVVLFSNDKDTARIMIDINFYLNRSYLQKETKYCFNTLTKKPLAIVNPNLNMYTTKLTKKHNKQIGYKPGSEEEWQKIYKKLKPLQNEFISLMKQEEEKHYKQIIKDMQQEIIYRK